MESGAGQAPCRSPRKRKRTAEQSSAHALPARRRLQAAAIARSHSPRVAFLEPVYRFAESRFRSCDDEIIMEPAVIESRSSGERDRPGRLSRDRRILKPCRGLVSGIVEEQIGKD